jgi:uncharacterized protein (TIRG00374 family)
LANASKVSLQRGLILSIGISVVSILLILALSRDDFEVESLRRVKIEYLLLGLAVIVGAWATKVLRLYLLCRSLGYHIGYRRLFDIYMSAVFVSHVTPFTFGGLPLQIYLMHKEGMPVGRSSAVGVVDSALTSCLLVVLGPVLLYLWKREYSLSPQVDRLVDVSIGIVVAVAVAFILLIAWPELLVRFLRAMAAIRGFRRLFTSERVEKATDWLLRETKQFAQAVKDMFSRSRIGFVLAVVCTFVYWALYLAIAPVTMVGLGVKVPVVRTLLAQIVFNIAQPFIPTPGGSGGSEIGFAFLFQSVVPRPRLPLFVSTWRFFTYYASLAVGGLLFYKAFGFRVLMAASNGKRETDCRHSGAE